MGLAATRWSVDLDSEAPEPPGAAAATTLTETVLLGCAWQYGHDGKPPAATALRFLPDGAIAGYDHPNERSWRLEGGALALFDARGGRTVQFDDVALEHDHLVLRGKYRLDPGLNVTLALRAVPVPATSAPGMSSIGYPYNDGGLNNQKLALLGLFKAAYDGGCAVVLPRFSIFDQVNMSRQLVPLDSVFDIAGLRSFADARGIPIRDAEPASNGLNGWDYLWKGLRCVAGHVNDQARDAPDRFAPDFVRGLVPLARQSFTVRKMIDEVFDRLGVTLVAQFRVEADWKRHTEKILRRFHQAPEEYSAPFERIVEKILHTLPETRRIYVTCDEAALPMSTAAMRDACKSKFGVGLLWKSDVLTRFELASLTPLQLSLIDFEMALHAPRFVGNSRSTFSNMAAFEKFCLTGRGVDEHYLYNTDTDRLALRTDNGTREDPGRAASVAKG
jgi:hypothetical protein